MEGTNQMAENEAKKRNELIEKVEGMDGLVGQLKSAIDSGDFKAVGQLAKQIAGKQAADEKTATEKRQTVLVELTAKVMKAIAKTIAPFADEMAEKGADGVWYTLDNVAKETDCRLIKRKVRTGSTGGGGGGGQRYAISTTDLLAKYGNELVGGEGAMAGMTYNDAWASTTEKNPRYQLRVKLIKLANVTS